MGSPDLSGLIWSKEQPIHHVTCSTATPPCVTAECSFDDNFLGASLASDTHEPPVAVMKRPRGHLLSETTSIRHVRQHHHRPHFTPSTPAPPTPRKPSTTLFVRSSVGGAAFCPTKACRPPNTDVLWRALGAAFAGFVFESVYGSKAQSKGKAFFRDVLRQVLTCSSSPRYRRPKLAGFKHPFCCCRNKTRRGWPKRNTQLETRFGRLTFRKWYFDNKQTLLVTDRQARRWRLPKRGVFLKRPRSRRWRTTWTGAPRCAVHDLVRTLRVAWKWYLTLLLADSRSTLDGTPHLHIRRRTQREALSGAENMRRWHRHCHQIDNV